MSKPMLAFELPMPTTLPPRREDFVSQNTKMVRRNRGWTQQKLADHIGVSQPQISAYERGNDDPSDEIVGKLAELAGSSIAAFRYTDLDKPVEPRQKIAISGFIEAGEVIVPATEAVDELELVELPPDLERTGLRALKLRPGVMPQFRSGSWCAFYRLTNNPGVAADCEGHLCIVKLRDGRMVLKELRRGYTPGRYNLRSVSGVGQDFDDQEVDWAARTEAFTLC